MNWIVRLAKPALRDLEGLSGTDRDRVARAILEMEHDPYGGDIQWLRNVGALRRRVGVWRIFFDIDQRDRLVTVTAIKRRTSTTY